MHRIVFTGAQGTGKTTVLNYFKDQGHKVITEVVRDLAQKGVKINKDGDEKGQTAIFKEYETRLAELDVDGYMSDRCLIDVVAYTKYLMDTGKVSDKFFNKQLKQLAKFRASHPDITYCYYPIEFPVVDDGVRDLDEEFRTAIDQNIQWIMKELSIQPITIKGTVEQRIEKVIRVYNWLNEGMKLYLGVD